MLISRNMSETLSDLLPAVAATTEALMSVLTADEIEKMSPGLESAFEAHAILEGADEVPAETDALLMLKSDATPFWVWALELSVSFLNLADLPPVQTVNSLRGTKEHQIRDKIQIANSVLVLAANYGSKNDNEELVKACEVYAEKMKTIIKRLCL